MTVSIPDSVPAEGNVKAVFVPGGLADRNAPTVAEVAAGVDISCFLMPDWDGPTATQNTGEQRRFCSKQSFGVLGRVSWTIAPLVYTYLPQGTDSDPANVVYVELAEGVTGDLLMFFGIEPEEVVTATDKADVFPVECGVQDKDSRGADEFAPLTVTQTLGVKGPRVPDVAVVA